MILGKHTATDSQDLYVKRRVSSWGRGFAIKILPTGIEALKFRDILCLPLRRWIPRIFFLNKDKQKVLADH